MTIITKIKQQTVSSKEIQISIYRAALNWHEWSDCFEHKGALDELPVFSNPTRLKNFTHEYGLRWLGNESQRAKFAADVLANTNFIKAIQQHNSSALDVVIEVVRDCVSNNRQQSAISKLATFASPSYFIAYDKYSRQGLNLLLGRNKGFRGSYAQYRLDVDKILYEEMGLSILVEMKKHDCVYINSTATQNAFQLRVLDNVLMHMGGRWS